MDSLRSPGWSTIPPWRHCARSTIVSSAEKSNAARTTANSAGIAIPQQQVGVNLVQGGCFETLRSTDLFAQALIAAKKRLDPNGMLNPGVLIDPEN
jgi:hypothetical protein